jgi:hypothetical protein
LLSIAGQLLFTWGMGFTSATAGSATTQLVPAVAWTLALGWLGEPVTVLGVVGALLCVSGVLLGVVPWREVLPGAAARRARSRSQSGGFPAAAGDPGAPEEEEPQAPR